MENFYIFFNKVSKIILALNTFFKYVHFLPFLLLSEINYILCMSIESSNILFKYSTLAGSSGNSTAQPDPRNSLGNYISTTSWTGSAANDLFDDITNDENISEQVDYRCIFIHNNH